MPSLHHDAMDSSNAGNADHSIRGCWDGLTSWYSPSDSCAPPNSPRVKIPSKRLGETDGPSQLLQQVRASVRCCLPGLVPEQRPEIRHQLRGHQAGSGPNRVSCQDFVLHRLRQRGYPRHNQL